MEDPYQFVENMDEKTLLYVRERNAEFQEKYGKTEEHTRERVTEYLSTKRILQALISDRKVATLYTANQKYHVSLDGKIIYSTDNVLSWIRMSDDGNRIAIFETSGSDSGILKIMSDGKIVQEIKGNITGLVFTPEAFYVVKSFTETPPQDGGEKNSHRVLLDGNIVFGSGLDSTKFIELQESNGKIIATVGDWNRSSIYWGNLDDPKTWRKVHDLESPAEPLGIIDNEVCYLEKKGNGVLKIGERSIIEFSEPVVSAHIVREGVLVASLRDAKIGISVFDFSGKKLIDFPLNEAMGLISSDSDEKEAVVVMDSFGIPYSLWNYENLSLKLLEENRLLRPRIEERWVESTGARVHYFLVEGDTHGKKSALAYGYGGYNVSLMPSYDPLNAALLTGGITIALANLRGGGEYGKEWHESGILEKKQNVFDDFIAVISQLKSLGYRVVAKGESNGGLLVGAMLTQRPDLLDGAVIGVPVLDMLRFHKMSVGKYWTTEYGNPDIRSDYEFLRKYSPYHNITDRNYPKTLVWSRLNDDRVHPAHGIKFHMKLSHFSTNAFLRLGESGGHSGMRPAEKIQEGCDILNFITDCFEETRTR